MKIGFLHLDLGIGGAERLVIDAALGLREAGHEVTIFTTHHDPDRCFPETRDGSLRVRVVGNALPNHTGARLRAPFAIARMAYLSARVGREVRDLDVVVCDGVAHAIPVWRLASRTPLVYYCNYPDLMLARSGGPAYRVYRAPIDGLEAAGIARADRVLVNSRFTAAAFERAFPRAAAPEVVYPGIDLRMYERVVPAPDDDCTILSIARYERAKSVALAIDALAHAPGRARLVIVGGYDERLDENRRTYAELEARARERGVADRVELRRSIGDAERLELLARCRFVVYTPPGEHFGLVPVEAMAAGRPVVATNDGGPRETIVDGETGLLCEHTAESFARAFSRLIADAPEARRMGEAGRRHVADRFSREAFGRRLDAVLRSVEKGVI